MGSIAHKPRDITCTECTGAATVRNPSQVTCSQECSHARKTRLERERYATRRGPPTVDAVFATRQRCADWAASHRNVQKQNAWLSGPPPYHTHLIGEAASLAYRPLPKWPVELRNTPGLHGALSALVEEPHQKDRPNFALIPSDSGWGVYWFVEAGYRFAGQTVRGALFDRPTEFSFGPRWRFRAPQIVKRGRRQIAIEAVTPIVLRKTDGAVVVRPTAEHLVGSLRGGIAKRLSPSEQWFSWVCDRVRLDLVSVVTEPVRVPFGGKFGAAHGWTGRVVVETNAVGHWLLVAAERIGLGARTGLGCGRIRVVPC